MAVKHAKAARPREEGGTRSRKPREDDPKAAGRQPRDLVARVVRALEYAAQSTRPVTAAEFSTQCGVPRASAYRIFARLQQERVLLPEPNGRGYAKGRRFADLAAAVLVQSPSYGARHRVLRSLVDEIGETCNLTMLVGSEIVYIDRVETDWPLRMHLAPGSHVPSHCTATGKLLLSLLPERQMKALVRAAPLRRYTERTITDPAKLVAELVRTRRAGIGIDDEEFAAGMVAVAVPVLDERGRARAAIAVHAPAVRLPLDAAKHHLPALRKAAAALSKLLF
ncbi:MAG TPA: IclR family transcriptional regulator [Usitatibacter sp.]|nr:IclR family transcriptional regulator [Usitatibacter sp.]